MCTCYLRTAILGSLVLALMAVLLPAHAGYITHQTEQMFDQQQGEESFRTVLFMKERPDVEGLRHAVRGMPRKERARVVWRQVNRLAEQSQQGLLTQVERLYRTGEVQHYRSLRILNAVEVVAPEEVIRNLAARPDVERVNRCAAMVLPQEEPEPLDGHELDEIVWGLEQINAPEVWDEGYTGEGVVVADIGSGVAYTHPDLADHLWDGGEEFPNHGYNFDDENNDTWDDHGHNTHMAGAILGDGTNGTATGVAPDATLMILRIVMTVNPSFEPSVWAALDFALEHEADVINFPIGYLHDWYPDRASWREAFDVVDAAGISTIAASGNEGYFDQPYSVRCPAGVPSPWANPDETGEGSRGGVITAGATNASDTYWNYSSRGPCTWEDVEEYGDWVYDNGDEEGLIKPDLVAPGVNIVSCWVDGDYTSFTGSNHATPYVTGLVALMLQKNPNLLPVEIDSILQTSALDLGADGKDVYYGAGRVRCDEALAMTPAECGILAGNVVDGNTGESVEDVQIQVLDTPYATQTDASGNYTFTVVTGVHTVQISKPPYHDQQQEEITILVDETTTLDITLAVGIYDASVDSLAATLVDYPVESDEFTVFNEGNGPLAVALNARPYVETDDFRDPLIDLNVTSTVNDTRLQGAAYGEGYFFVAGSNNFDNPNYIYVLNEEGEMVNSYIQPGSDDENAGPTGMRDLAYGEDKVWGGIDGDIVAMDPGTGEEIRRFDGPYNPNRAIAYDDIRKLVWVATYGENIIGLDAYSGVQVEEIEADLDINGIGFHGPNLDGFDLWLSVRDDPEMAALYKANPETDEIVLVETMETNSEEIEGLSFADGYLDSYVAGIGMVNQAGDDHLLGWEWGAFLPWIELDPVTFAIAPFDSQVVDVLWIGGHLERGTYTGYIDVEHDGINEADIIPIQLTVEYNTATPEAGPSDVPREFALDPPYPNPFNSTASVRFALPQASRVTLTVFDVLGREVARLQEGIMPPGYHAVTFEATQLASGVYFLRMETDHGFNKVNRLMLLK